MTLALPDPRDLDPETRRRLRVLRDELRHRARCRASICAWFEGGPPTLRGTPVLEAWQRDFLTRLEAVLREWVALPPGPRPIWIVNVAAPPQLGKSEAVKRAVAWAMAELGLTFGFASYGASLAEEHSIAVRAMMRSPEARAVWPWLDGRNGRPDEAPKDTQADWGIPSPTPGRLGARFIARGRDGALTGRPMDGIVIDDIYKDAGDYGSPAARREVDAFLRSAALARLMERGGLVLQIGTRWGTDDARGWFDRVVREITAAGGTVRAETWTYPLVAREHDTLGRAPGQYLTHRWDAAKERSARVFYGAHARAILDCDPVPDEGALFKSEWLEHTYTLPPREQARACDRVWLSCDPNRKRTRAGSLASVQVWGQIGSHRLWLHREAGRWSYTELRAVVRRVASEWRCLPVLIEGAASGDALVDDLQGEVDGLVTIQPRPQADRKWVDAQTSAVYWQAKQVLLPLAVHPGCEWVAEVRPTLLRYTGDPNDETDDIDAMTQAILWSRDTGIDAAGVAAALADVFG